MAYDHGVYPLLKLILVLGYQFEITTFKAKWKNNLIEVVYWVHQIIGVASLISHVISTTTRSIRYMPEFFQRLFEDAAFNLLFIEAHFIRANFQDLHELIQHMETSFSTQETEIVEKTYAKAKFIFYVCVTSAIGCLSGSILETFFTVSQEELDLLSHIYDRKYPNNRLQTNFWVPDIDDSEPPYYQIIFVTELYLIYLIILLTILSVSLIPMLVTHIAGQYEILCNRIQSLGHSSIMWNKRRPIDDLQDRESLRSIMQAHKNLISAQSKLQNLYSAGMFIKVVFNNIMFALCLYQLTLSNTNTVSKFRVYKLTLEFLTVAVTYYYLCHCSEILDDCNSKLCDAIWNSRWYHCSRHVQKDLIMFLRRVQRPNHLKCLHGAIILSHVYFLGVVKVSYSFVNCMRFKSRL